jgi:hypothetical protein
MSKDEQHDISDFYITTQHASNTGGAGSPTTVLQGMETFNPSFVIFPCPANAYVKRVTLVAADTIDTGATVTMSIGGVLIAGWSWALPAGLTGATFSKAVPAIPSSYAVQAMEAGTFPGESDESRSILKLICDGGALNGIARFVVTMGR